MGNMIQLSLILIMLYCGMSFGLSLASGPDALEQDVAGSLVEEKDLFSDDSLGAAVKEELFIEVLSRPRSCVVKVNGKTVLYRDKLDAKPPPSYFSTHMSMEGTYAVVVHPTSGERTADVHATGHDPNGAFYGMEELLNNVQKGRIVAFCTMGEAALSMDSKAEDVFRALNSSYMPDLQMRSMFAMVAVKDGDVLAEGYNVNLDALDWTHPGYTLRLTVSVPKKTFKEAVCDQLQTPEHSERAAFCQKHDGYRGLCDCDNLVPTKYAPKPFEDGTFFKFPVVIMASNRPQYLFRCLSSLLPVRGLDLSRLVVFLDGDFPEVRQLLMLLGIRLHRHVVEPIGLASRAVGTRIGFNYRYTIEQAFNMFPDAEKLVLLEEDLEVAPDFLSYFQQTHHLLDKDVSLYCISAWNDHGYQHTVGDPAMLYRIGTLPGLGWMLKRSFFFNEVIPIWPEDWETFDWDVLLRLGSIRRGRDCIIPDVSRTYHFGFVGNHVNSGMQFAFFYDHALNTIPDVKLKDVDRMVFHEYEKLLHELVTTGTKLDGDAHTNSTSCKRIIPSDTKNQTYLIFLRMYGPEDTEPWLKVATCLNLWDMDSRGDHHGIWRFWYNGNHIMVLGVPFSRLSAFAVNNKDDVTVFGGKRSKAMRVAGRWPPGMRRDSTADRQRRMRLSAAALRINPAFISEVTENSRA